MKNASYILAGLALTFTLFLCWNATSNPYSVSAFYFILLTISPYGFLVLLTSVAKSKISIAVVLIFCILVSLFGVVLLFDAVYIHYMDAQNDMFYTSIPLFQWIALAVVVLPVLLLNKVGNT